MSLARRILPIFAFLALLLALPGAADAADSSALRADGGHAVAHSTAADGAGSELGVRGVGDPPVTGPIRLRHTDEREDSVGTHVGIAAKTGTSAYDVAISGGRHAGFLNNYVGRSTPEIERGIASIEKQVAEHQAKIRDPAAYIDDWANLDPRQQQALLTSKWPGDIARQQEQLDILRGILGSR